MTPLYDRVEMRRKCGGWVGCQKRKLISDSLILINAVSVPNLGKIVGKVGKHWERREALTFEIR